MLKFVIAALVALELILLGSLLTPANAAVKDTEVYTWDYQSVGSSQVVCKQVTFHPQDRPLPPEAQVQPATIRSKIVSDRFCENLTKPTSKVS